MNEQQAQYQNQQMQQAYTNSSRYNNNSALQVRLNTDPILEKVELFLRGGKYIHTQTDDGTIITKFIEQGKAKANDEGTQSIINKLGAVFNSQTVQGNFSQEEYENYIEEININLVKAIIINCNKWGIKDDDIDYITDFIMEAVIPFMSRTKDNEERKSYGDTIKTVENTTVQNQQKRGFLGF